MIGGKVRKIRNQKAYGIYVNGKLHSAHPTRRHAKKCLCGGMPMKDLPGSVLHNISTYLIPEFPLGPDVEHYAPAELSMMHGLPVVNRMVRDENSRAVTRLHRDFMDITGLTFANESDRQNYDNFIGQSGKTELEIAKLPIAQRTKLIRDFRSRSRSSCVASGKLMKEKSLASLAFNALPRTEQEAYNEGAYGMMPKGIAYRQIKKAVKGSHLIPVLRERIDGARTFTQLPIQNQIAVIQDEDLTLEDISRIYTTARLPIPFAIIQAL